MRICLYTRKSDSTPIKVMEACVGLGLILAIIAFFLTMNVVISAAYWEEAYEVAYLNPTVIAANVLTWVALPLSLISSIGVAFLNRCQHAVV